MMQQTLHSDDLCKLREDWLSSKPERSEEQSAGAGVVDLQSKGKGRTRTEEDKPAQKQCQPHVKHMHLAR